MAILQPAICSMRKTMAKKEKVTYVDDGRTIADMSGVKAGMPRSDRNPYAPRSSLKEQWQTYKAAVKMMVKPMLVFVAGILVMFAIVYLLFSAM